MAATFRPARATSSEGLWWGWQGALKKRLTIVRFLMKGPWRLRPPREKGKDDRWTSVHREWNWITGATWQQGILSQWLDHVGLRIRVGSMRRCQVQISSGFGVLTLAAGISSIEKTVF